VRALGRLVGEGGLGAPVRQGAARVGEFGSDGTQVLLLGGELVGLDLELGVE